MRKVEDIHEIKYAIKEIHQRGDDWFTNLLADDDEIKRWIYNEQLSYFVASNNLFILRVRHGCQRIYFSTSNLQELTIGFKEFLKHKEGKVITSVLDRNGVNMHIKKILFDSGFRSYGKLNRVSMINILCTGKPERIKFAGMEDLPQIEKNDREVF